METRTEERPLSSWTRGDPNELGVIWADPAQTEPLAVEDYDGCRAWVRAATPDTDEPEPPRGIDARTG